MQNEPIWLDRNVVIKFNKRIVARTGEIFLFNNPDGLDSALGSLILKFLYGETDIIRLAVSLLFKMTRNNAFLQGNKRTAFQSMLTFLKENGFKNVAIPELGEVVEI